MLLFQVNLCLCGGMLVERVEPQPIEKGGSRYGIVVTSLMSGADNQLIQLHTANCLYILI
jgi:hypothetical protein